MQELVAEFHQSASFSGQQKRKTEVVITGFDYDLQKSLFFKSFNKQSTNSEIQKRKRTGIELTCAKITLVDACHVSSNAPVIYFDDPAQAIYGDREIRGWDGATGGYNNPVLAGVTEALTIYDCSASDLFVLSIGTANKNLPIAGSKNEQGYSYKGSERLFRRRSGTSAFAELSCLAKTIVAEPPSSATFVAAMMLGHTYPFDMSDFRLVRMNPVIQPNISGEHRELVEAPDWCGHGLAAEKKFEKLANMDMDATKDDEVKLIVSLGESWLHSDVQNQLIVRSGTPARRKGHNTYEQAKIAWQGLC